MYVTGYSTLQLPSPEWNVSFEEATAFVQPTATGREEEFLGEQAYVHHMENLDKLLEHNKR